LAKTQGTDCGKQKLSSKSYKETYMLRHYSGKVSQGADKVG